MDYRILDTMIRRWMTEGGDDLLDKIKILSDFLKREEERLKLLEEKESLESSLKEIKQKLK